MKARHLTTMAVAVAVVMVAGCSGKQDVKASPLLGEARQVATAAALKLVATDHGDTLAMQNCILEAKSLQAKFQVARDTMAVNAFNRAFKKALQDNDPALAKEIFVERPSQLKPGEPWDEFEQLVADSAWLE